MHARAFTLSSRVVTLLKLHGSRLLGSGQAYQNKTTHSQSVEGTWVSTSCAASLSAASWNRRLFSAPLALLAFPDSSSASKSCSLSLLVAASSSSISLPDSSYSKQIINDFSTQCPSRTFVTGSSALCLLVPADFVSITLPKHCSRLHIMGFSLISHNNWWYGQQAYVNMICKYVQVQQSNNSKHARHADLQQFFFRWQQQSLCLPLAHPLDSNGRFPLAGI